jgi:hypothetical protein
MCAFCRNAPGARWVGRWAASYRLCRSAPPHRGDNASTRLVGRWAASYRSFRSAPPHGGALPARDWSAAGRPPTGSVGARPSARPIGPWAASYRLCRSAPQRATDSWLVGARLSARPIGPSPQRHWSTCRLVNQPLHTGAASWHHCMSRAGARSYS